MTSKFDQVFQRIFNEKKKGVDGKACWKGYRHAGTKDGKDKCVKVSEAAKCTGTTKKTSSTSKGKKYMKGRFKKFILSVQDQDMPSQLASFDKEFNAWKGKQEQIDDVCVMGVRV